jgi:hypothetical protein
MHSFGTLCVLLGMLIAILAQIVGAALIFRSDILKGILSLAVPGYVLFALHREGSYRKIIAAWGMGLLGLAIGTILLS